MPISYLNQSALKKWHGKTCILRADLDIKSGEEHISLRIPAMLPTIRLLLKHEIKVVLMGHRGRPITRKSTLSLKPFAKLLAKKLKQKITFIPHFNFPRIQKQIQSASRRTKNHVFLLENLRFLPAERKDSTRLAKTLASLGDFFVNDSFAESHRKHTSVSAITRFLPSYAGLHLEIEMQRLTYVMKRFKRPLTIILGGTKISSKIGVIRYFWRKADQFLLGGGPANTFLAAQGLPIGNSIFEPHAAPLIKKFINSDKIKLPTDLKIKNRQILDIGPKTIKKYGEIIKRSKTIIWSGPVGLFEKKEYAEGTRGIWKAILSAGRRNKKALIVVGGGETTTSFKLLQPITRNLPPNIFLSTGGGAMLEFLSGKKLPGIEALKK